MGLGVELHPPHSSLFHSLLPACISLLQLRVITEWAGQQLEGRDRVGIGEWGTWPAPQTRRETLELLVKMSASAPASPAKVRLLFLTAEKAIIKISKCSGQPSWQNTFTLLTLMFPAALEGEANQSGPFPRRED